MYLRSQLFCFVLVLSLSLGACTRTAFSPIWYGLQPNTVFDLKDKGDWHGSVEYSDVDNGSGVTLSAVHSPKSHLAVGMGISTLGNKGTFYLTDAINASSRLYQGNVSVGTYWNTKKNFLSLQCFSGFGYGSAQTKFSGASQIKLAYQKLFIQPAIILHLPNNMSLDASWRLSQVYYTSASVHIGVVPQDYVNVVMNIENNSPFRMAELGIGYSYDTGPIQTGIQYNIASNYGGSGQPNFDFQAITTSVKFNIAEIVRQSKKQDKPLE